MRKMIWFTDEQVKQFEFLKKATGLNGSEVVREAIKRMHAKELKGA